MVWATGVKAPDVSSTLEERCIGSFTRTEILWRSFIERAAIMETK
jgi:hypothetical protein